MNIELTSHAQSILQRHLSSGEYASPEDLIEHALDLLDAQEPTMESLKAKIQVGREEMAAGLGTPLDAEGIIRRGEARLAAKLQPRQ